MMEDLQGSAASSAVRDGREIRRPGAVATVCRNEIRQMLGDFRFYAAALLLLTMTALAAVTAGARYRSELLVQAALRGRYAREVAGAPLDRLAETLHPAIKDPPRLGLVVDGGQSAAPDLYSQAPSSLIAPELRRIESGNYRLPGRAPLDWLFTIRVVLPLAAFLLGHDAICGERRRGTLKLLLSYPVAHATVLLGKLLALWCCLVIPLLAGMALSLLIAGGPGGIDLDPESLKKAGLVVLLGAWAAAFFALLSLLVSALARDASASLSVLAWLLVAGVIVGPAVSGLLAHRLHPIPTEGEIRRQMERIDRQVAHEAAGWESRWRRPAWARADGFAWERMSAAVENRRFALQESVRRRALETRLEQARLARSLSSLSPMSLIEELAELLTGSGPWRDESFLAQARVFRQVLTERLRALDAGDGESPHILFFRGYLSQRPVAAGALPYFVFHEQPAGSCLAAARPALALLLLETAVLGTSTWFIFSRQDPG
ncbi:MAG: ABC transporter permease subunit [Acidobacteriota bacterium]|nr:ABC transporter permease subunit [Acidobacteriota bacterium]